MTHLAYGFIAVGIEYFYFLWYNIYRLRTLAKDMHSRSFT